jgi:hypothetical protein
MSTENFCALCREYGISARAAYKWRNRFIDPRSLRNECPQTRRPDHTEKNVLSREAFTRFTSSYLRTLSLFHDKTPELKISETKMIMNFDHLARTTNSSDLPLHFRTCARRL